MGMSEGQAGPTGPSCKGTALMMLFVLTVVVVASAAAVVALA